MGLFFSSRKRISRVTDHDKAVLQLKVQRDNLKRFQQKIQLTLENDRALVKRLLSDGKKDRAKLLLRKKRYQEQLLERTDNQLETLEKMTQDLEFAQIEIKVVEGLKQGSSALKKINDILDIQEIEKIMEETREGVEKQKEIDELISGALTNEDEEEVENELTQLIAENVDLPKFPEVPDEALHSDTTRENTKKEKQKKSESTMIAA